MNISSNYTFFNVPNQKFNKFIFFVNLIKRSEIWTDSFILQFVNFNKHFYFIMKTSFKTIMYWFTLSKFFVPPTFYSHLLYSKFNGICLKNMMNKQLFCVSRALFSF